MELDGGIEWVKKCLEWNCLTAYECSPGKSSLELIYASPMFASIQER
jgi:hypothetical protein